MSITALKAVRHGNTTRVTAVSDLAAPGTTVFYHWYVDGRHVGVTGSSQRVFALEAGEQFQVDVIDTTDADYDGPGNAPTAWPARKRLWWIRSMSDDVDYYLVQQKTDGDWYTIAKVQHDPRKWDYEILTPRLEDLAEHTWRITPYDRGGNAGTAKTIGPEKVVRTPDAPDYTISFDDGTTRVTFAAA